MPATAHARTASRRLALEIALFKVLVFTLLTSVGALIAVPLPPDGVPMTLQTLMVVLAALCIGPRLGAISMVLYVLIGMLGAGVFAQGEKGLGVILGQTGGFLVGFIACQPVIGAIVKDKHNVARGWLALIAGVLAGHAVIFAIGVPWFGIVNHYSVDLALAGSFYPYLPGMVVKAGLAVVIGLAAYPNAVRRVW